MEHKDPMERKNPTFNSSKTQNDTVDGVSEYDADGITITFVYRINKGVYKIFKDKKFPFYILYITPLGDCETKVWVYRLLRKGILSWRWGMEPEPLDVGQRREFFTRLLADFVMFSEMMESVRFEKTTWNQLEMVFTDAPDGIPILPTLISVWEKVFVRHCQVNKNYLPEGTMKVTVDVSVGAHLLVNIKETVKSIDRSLPPHDTLLNPYSPIIVPLPYGNVSERNGKRNFVPFIINFGKLADGRPIPSHLNEILIKILKGESPAVLVKGFVDPV